MSHSAEFWLEALHGLGFNKPVRIMNVCGGHERAISLAGLRSAIPGNIELVPGPGCPVCICPEEDVFAAMQIALNEDVILVAFGDMLRFADRSRFHRAAKSVTSCRVFCGRI
jgi:hydrogenase expression/formation protein HypD